MAQLARVRVGSIDPMQLLVTSLGVLLVVLWNADKFWHRYGVKIAESL